MSVTEITETRQYLTFKLGNEIFATDVAKVREVLDFTHHHGDSAHARFHERSHQSPRAAWCRWWICGCVSRCRRPSRPATPASWWWRCCWKANPP